MAQNTDLKIIVNICRFCLSEDENYLIPVQDVLDFELTIEDLVRFTGIQLNDEHKASCVVCLECTNKLKISSTFRNACLRNDALFHALCRVVLDSRVQQTYDETVEYLESDFEGEANSDTYPEDEPIATDICPSEDGSSPLPSAVKELQHRTQPSSVVSIASTIEEANSEDELFGYSANYIKPGEILYAEDVVHRSYVDWNTSLNPKHAPTAPYPRERGKRRLYMCEKCALIVKHLPTHMQVHEETATFACPYCPAKMKQKNNISQHILQVHYKAICRTCKICGKGFVHHKTYRYHMLTHEGEGKRFACQDCSKTFPNAIYLRDHFNRIHNAARTGKTNGESGPKTPRKKRRLNAVLVNKYETSSDSE
uniref:Uncharacterized protein n=1 Tax=Anopheles gambiae TaxID=7165 RepID=A0A453Z102_ANOGA